MSGCKIRLAADVDLLDTRGWISFGMEATRQASLAGVQYGGVADIGLELLEGSRSVDECGKSLLGCKRPCIVDEWEG